MKLLLDANLSWRLVQLISDDFPGSVHVNSTSLNKPASDLEIWNYALLHDYVIVTNDEDFKELSAYRGFPPKIILLKTGNIKTQQVYQMLQDLKVQIHSFQSSSEIGVFEIF